MRILIDIGHPGHVLHFRYFIEEMKKKRHKIKVIAKDKDVAMCLLKSFNINYVNLGKTKKGLFSKLFSMFRINLKTLRLSLKFKPDLLIGRSSPHLAFTSFMLRKPYLCFSDTEHALVNKVFAHPFASKIITPKSFKKELGKKQVKVDSYFEVAYLHPNYFKPNSSILKEVGLKKKEKFFLLRFISWGAHHDIGKKGLSINDKRDLIKLLEKYGRVIINSEGKLSSEFEKYNLKLSPERIHNLIYYSSMFISESGTMSTEASLLGVPSVYIKPPYFLCGVHIDQINKYGIKFWYPNLEQAKNKIIELLRNKNLKEEWQEKRKKLFKDKVDMTKWMVNFCDDFMKKNNGCDKNV